MEIKESRMVDRKLEKTEKKKATEKEKIWNGKRHLIDQINKMVRKKERKSRMCLPLKKKCHCKNILKHPSQAN